MFITSVNLLRLRRVSCIIALSIICICCSDTKDEVTIKEPTPIAITLPSNLPAPAYDLSINPITKEGFDLGKKLFYDPILSKNNTISCGSCHQQPFAFTHHGHDVSHGINDKLGRRNSMAIQNLLWYRSFFWDGGVHNLDLVPLNAIANEVEMDEDTENIITKLQAQEKYRERFQAAFGSDKITSTQFLQALSQFLASMISANSRYDKYIRSEGLTLTDEELAGMALFKTNCSTCHASDLFTDQSFRNNGFSSTADLARDKGREEITLNAEDRGKFKVPSLRNIEYTAPYMHNGKLKTLEDVLQFYTEGVNDTPFLDPLLKSNGRLGLDLSKEDQKRIIAFLKTLTDEEFVSDRRFSEF